MLYTKGLGRYEKEYAELWDKLVPGFGQANSVQGELVRVIGRLGSEFDRNGNGNWDMGFRMYTNFLFKYLRDEATFDAPTLSQIEADIEEIRAFGNGKKDLVYDEGEDAFDRVTDRIVEWCQQHPEPISHKRNPKLKR